MISSNPTGIFDFDLNHFEDFTVETEFFNDNGAQTSFTQTPTPLQPLPTNSLSPKLRARDVNRQINLYGEGNKENMEEGIAFLSINDAAQGAEIIEDKGGAKTILRDRVNGKCVKLSKQEDALWRFFLILYQAIAIETKNFNLMTRVILYIYIYIVTIRGMVPKDSKIGGAVL